MDCMITIWKWDVWDWHKRSFATIYCQLLLYPAYVGIFPERAPHWVQLPHLWEGCETLGNLHSFFRTGMNLWSRGDSSDINRHTSHTWNMQMKGRVGTRGESSMQTITTALRNLRVQCRRQRDGKAHGRAHTYRTACSVCWADDLGESFTWMQ